MDMVLHRTIFTGSPWRSWPPHALAVQVHLLLANCQMLEFTFRPNGKKKKILHNDPIWNGLPCFHAHLHHLESAKSIIQFSLARCQINLYTKHAVISPVEILCFSCLDSFWLDNSSSSSWSSTNVLRTVVFRLGTENWESESPWWTPGRKWGVASSWRF